MVLDERATDLRLGPATVQWTARAEGDARIWMGSCGVAAPAVQPHGAEVAVVDGPGPAGAVDAVATAVPGLPVGVRVADCGPLALAARRGRPAVAAVHCGWAGLLAGVVGAAAGALRRLGGSDLAAALGPCIGPCCYEFGPADLDPLAAALGDGVRSTTADGRPALDLRAAVAAACAAAGVDVVHVDPRCTAHHAGSDGSAELWSHRARRDEPRQAVVAWLR